MNTGFFIHLSRMPGLRGRLFLAGLFAGMGLGVHATEITLDRSTYLPGEPIRIAFRDGPGNMKDWIGLYPEGAVPQDYIDWQYLDGTQVGNLTVTDGEVVFPNGLAQAGSYKVYLLVNDGYGIAATAFFNVAVVPRVRADKQAYRPGEAIEVEFLNGPNNAKDWVAIYEAEPPLTTLIDWFYVDGTQEGNAGRSAGRLSFPGGVGEAGNYIAYFFENDTFTVLDTAPFTIESIGPRLTLTPGDRQVRLAWEAATQPAPVAKYEVWSAAGLEAPFTRLAEVTGLEYLHSGLPNGVEVCYRVRAVSATGTLGPDSALQCTAPYVLGPDEFIAYSVPPGTAGNYSFSGVMGMDFEVINPIRVTELGVFDDGANGMKRTVTVNLYNRETMQVLASLRFDPIAFDPGVLKGGSRFKPLPAPLDLPLGFKGTIAADGFGPEEKAGSSRIGDLGLRFISGRDSIFFNSSRLGVPGAFPGSLESGPPNLYAAGTFAFTATPPVAPGKPLVTAIPDDASVTLFWQTVHAPLAAVSYEVFRGDGPLGPFQKIADTTDTAYLDTGLVNNMPVYYVIGAVASGGGRGVRSEVVEMTPNRVEAGIAYVVPAMTAGNQQFGGSAGNDFDVLRPLRITRLGVFDDGSDGLNRPIKCRLYDRVARTELALLLFTATEPGELIGGSRFKDLPQPISLPIGFQGAIVASGYGEGERDGNKGAGPMNIEVFTGGCLRFVGTARWGENPDTFPEIIDGGPADRYAAGTFYFEPLNELARVSIALAASNVRLNWTGAGVLQSAPTPGGPWEVVLGAVSGFQISPSDGARFYRVRLGP